MKKIYYWCPFIDKVATVKSVINSANSLKKYDKNYTPIILNTLGEWDDYKNDIQKKKIDLVNLTNSKLLKQKPKSKSFLSSRSLYFLIISKLFFPLIKFLKKNENEILIVHLITSLPLILNIWFKNKNVILRVSGLPRLNFFRKLIWEVAIKNVSIVFCPTVDTKNNLEKKFPNHKEKFKLLRDPIISISEISNLKKQINNNSLVHKDYFVSIGRLTKQKNFIFLIKCFSKIAKVHKDIKLVIIGAGEEKDKIENLIKINNLKENVILLGYQKNVFKFLKNCNAFILSSLWEDPGFVLIEAIVSDCLVLSSDCPNGPKEIIENNRGLLFKNNSENDFLLKFNQLINLSDLKKKEFKVNAKKKIKNFSIFNHYQQLSKILIS